MLACTSAGCTPWQDKDWYRSDTTVPYPPAPGVNCSDVLCVSAQGAGDDSTYKVVAGVTCVGDWYQCFCGCFTVG